MRKTLDFRLIFCTISRSKPQNGTPNLTKMRLTLMGHRAYKIGNFLENHVGRVPSRGVSWIFQLGIEGRKAKTI
jgi:hypothetical protein